MKVIIRKLEKYINRLFLSVFVWPVLLFIIKLCFYNIL